MKTKRSKLFIFLALSLAVALAVAGCKVDSSNVEKEQAPMSMPDVIINQPVKEEKNVISVMGIVKNVLAPDMATVEISVTTHETTALEAQNKNNALMTAVVASIKENGIAETDIQTGFLNLTEEFDYNKNPAKLVGYSMSNRVTVTVRSIDALGKILSDAVTAGATGTGNISFGISDSSEAYRSLLAEAMKDAAAKARAIADAAGAQLSVIPTHVYEQSYSETPAPQRVAVPMTGDMRSSVPVSPGEITVTAEVHVDYEMLPPA